MVKRNIFAELMMGQMHSVWEGMEPHDIKGAIGAVGGRENESQPDHRVFFTGYGVHVRTSN